MSNLTKQLDNLFEKWKNEREFTHFYKDGLMYRGKYLYENKIPYWRKPGKESELWEKCPTRVMFVLKDTNANGDTEESDDDLRGRVFYNTTYPGYKNMTYWLYGILKTIETGHAPEFTFSDEEASMLYDATPVAYINCKKQGGGKSCHYNTLVDYIERDKDFLTKEFEILNPDIIICCAYTENTGNPILDYVEKNICPDLVKINGWVHYSKQKNKVVINAYHVKTRTKGCNYKSMYTEMTEAFEEFIKKYPKFKNIR